MFSVVAVGWGNQEDTQEFNDVVKAATYAELKSVDGNTDYVIIAHNGMPKIKYQDGEMVPL